MSSDIFGNFSEKYSFTGAFFSDSTLMYIWKENFAFGWLGFGTAKLDSTKTYDWRGGEKKKEGLLWNPTIVSSIGKMF